MIDIAIAAIMTSALTGLLLHSRTRVNGHAIVTRDSPHGGFVCTGCGKIRGRKSDFEDIDCHVATSVRVTLHEFQD